jgi:hypothetical protein
MNSTSGVNDACIAANAGSEWKCIFAEHTSPHIKTPIFPLQGEYDSWQMCCDAGYETKDAKTDAQVRKSPILSWPSSWANFSLCRCIPTGMHGPTCIVWANLTPSSLQINAWGAKLTALVHSNLLGPNPKHGIFLDSCLHHCGCCSHGP